MAVPWRIYYGDGTTFDGDPFDAPAVDVQIIAQTEERVGRILVARYDYYWWDQDRWWGGDIFGLFDYLTRSPGPKRVLMGRSLTNEAFDRVFGEAIEDPDLPAKSAWYEHEPKRKGG